VSVTLIQLCYAMTYAIHAIYPSNHQHRPAIHQQHCMHQPSTRFTTPPYLKHNTLTLDIKEGHKERCIVSRPTVFFHFSTPTARYSYINNVKAHSLCLYNSHFHSYQYLLTPQHQQTHSRQDALLYPLYYRFRYRRSCYQGHCAF
jgi:hypothetical protein